MLEVRALEQATRFIRQAHQVRRGKPRAILSMVGKHYRLTHDMRAAAASHSLGSLGFGSLVVVLTGGALAFFHAATSTAGVLSPGAQSSARAKIPAIPNRVLGFLRSEIPQ